MFFTVGPKSAKSSIPSNIRAEVEDIKPCPVVMADPAANVASSPYKM